MMPCYTHVDLFVAFLFGMGVGVLAFVVLCLLVESRDRKRSEANRPLVEEK
jgi:hypothetical protein